MSTCPFISGHTSQHNPSLLPHPVLICFPPCCSHAPGTPGKAQSSLGDGDSENFSFPVTPPSEPAPAGPVFGHGFGRASSGVSHGVRTTTGCAAGRHMLHDLHAAPLGLLPYMLQAQALTLYCSQTAFQCYLCSLFKVISSLTSCRWLIAYVCTVL